MPILTTDVVTLNIEPQFRDLEGVARVAVISYRPESTLNEPFLAQEMVTVTIFDEAGKPMKHGYMFFIMSIRFNEMQEP